jgi:NAD(P)-dependent dehydrogenase (short-subunit alcohol dehydrogenase family)
MTEARLLGQTVVVIGGSAGLGLDTARRAGAKGAGFILTGRDPVRLRMPPPKSGRVRSGGALGGTASRSPRVVTPADVAAPAVHLMTNTTLTGVT